MTTKKHTSRGPKFSLLIAQKREVGAAEFKAHCLELMDEVDRLGIEITITKHRKPIAKLVPAQAKATRFCGSMKGSILYEGDLVSPIDLPWEAEEE
jgi:prevent-host-death family protein